MNNSFPFFSLLLQIEKTCNRRVLPVVIPQSPDYKLKISLCETSAVVHLQFVHPVRVPLRS